jgi:hypothetical protein
MPIVPTYDELYAAGSTEALARNPNLTDRRPGSAMDAVIGVGATLADESIRIGLQGFKAVFFDTATGADLDALVLDRTGLTRNAASFAVGAVTFTRSQIIGIVEVPAGTRVAAVDADGAQYVFATVAASQFVSGAATVSVPVEASVSGPESNVAAYAITRLLDALSDPEVTATNPTRTAGGDVAESDDRLRARVRRYYTSLRRGTVGALEAGANANAELVALVETALEKYRAAGVAVYVEAMERQEIAITFTMRVKSLLGLNLTALKANLSATVIAWSNTLPGGSTLYVSRMLAEAVKSSPAFIDGETTASDIAPTNPYSAIRIIGVETTIEVA